MPLTKERREEIREALAKEDLPGWKTEFILHIDDPFVGLYLEEIRTLLESDERLEKIEDEIAGLLGYALENGLNVEPTVAASIGRLTAIVTNRTEADHGPVFEKAPPTRTSLSVVVTRPDPTDED